MSSFPKHLHLAKENSFDDTSSDEEVTPKSYQKIQTIWKDLRQVSISQCLGANSFLRVKISLVLSS